MSRLVRTPGRTLLAYRFALDPTPAQERALRSHAGAARVAFNWGLARVKAVMDQQEAEASYGIPRADRTPSISWSAWSLRKDWNVVKETVAPWWRECSKEAYATGLDQLGRALKNWSDSRRGKRKGPPVGFPRFRSKRASRQSIRFSINPMRCEASHVVLPKIGSVKIYEDGARLADLIQAGTARVIGVSVRFDRGRWFAAFTVEQVISRPAPTRPDVAVGVDLGIKSLAVGATTTGQTFEVPNPRHLGRALRKIQRLSRTVSRRQGPDRRTGAVPSARWRRANAERNRAVSQVTDQRQDALHKLTTTLARTYGTVVIEDLHVAGMVRNRRLARHVADASFGEIRRQLTYKTAWHGGTLIVADRWFASSKTCSGCGAAKTKLALSERTYVCTTCGLVLDRDVNAAVNLARLAGSGSDSNGRGADRKTGLARQVAVKRQPGTAKAGQAGTVPSQDRTAA